MTILIRRESRNGKFFVVARDKARYVAIRKWNKKFTVPKAKRLFKKNNTLTEGLTSRKLSSRPFTQFTDRRKKPKIPKDIPFRVVVTGVLKDGTIIASSSMARHWNNFNEAKAEADKSFLERLAFESGDNYDADEGLKHIKKVRSMKSEVIFVK